MIDAETPASEAGRALAQARWRSVKLDRQIEELAARSAELGPKQVTKLQAIVAEKDTTGQEAG